jgi:putative ABC transport system permease protein
MFRTVTDWARFLFSKDSVERELDRELQLHLELETEKYVEQGLSRQEARIAALRSFGSIQQVKEECRDFRLGRSCEAFLRDFRYSLRALIKSPGFTAVVVLSLAIGIGASSAVFSVVNSLLLRPYAFPSLDQLVLVRETQTSGGQDQKPLAPADFLDFRAAPGAFTAIAAFRFRTFNMTQAGDAEAIEGFQVSPNFFDVIGVSPAMGRTFDPEQDQQGKDRSAILRYGFWRQRFGGDPDIIGRSITLNGNSFNVTGIMPDGFNYPLGGDFWVPLALTTQEKTERSAQSLDALARLAEDASLAQGAAHARALAGRLQELYPATNLGRTLVLQRLREEQYRYTAPLFLTLQGAALFVLLLACANVTNLLLARVIGRQREMAIRRALGSSRFSVVRLFLSEALLVSCLAAGAAVALAYWSANFIRVAIPEGMSKWIAGWNDIRLDGNVLGFTLLLACVVALVFGLAAAFHSSKFDLNTALKETCNAAGATTGRRRLRNSLVVAEMVFAMVLLVAAGLMIRGFFRQVDVFQGYQPANILVANLRLPEQKYRDPEVQAFFARALSGMVSLPGVESAAITRNIPASNVDNETAFFSIEGRAPVSAAEYPVADSQIVSGDFFTTLRIPVLEGRAFTRLDGTQAPLMAVINQSMSRRYWAGQDPVGSRIKLGAPDSQSPWLTIAGICGDIKQNWWDPAGRPMVYRPSTQVLARSMYLVIRTAGDPMQIVSEARAAVARVDPDQPLNELHTLEREVTDSVAPLRIIGILMVVFGALALVLSAIGVFSVLAYSVAERTGEFGLRVALGASPRDVIGIVHKQTLRLAAAGVAIGAPAALAFGWMMSRLLFGVVALDAGTVAGFTLLLIAVSLLAGHFPARRAARVDPIISLRNE